MNSVFITVITHGDTITVNCDQESHFFFIRFYYNVGDNLYLKVEIEVNGVSNKI